MSEIMYLGIDEAGKGAALGDMYMAGVVASPEVAQSWVAAGLKESKQMSREDRDKMADRIKDECARYIVTGVVPSRIDEFNIDCLEFQEACDLIKQLEPTHTFIDCPGNPKEWLDGLALLDVKSELTVVYKADEQFPIVAAASVLAKNARDYHVDIFGFPNGGYNGDAMWRWLSEEIKKKGKVPHYVRQSWKNMRAFLEQEGFSGDQMMIS